MNISVVTAGRYCCAPPHSGQNLAGFGIVLPQLMQNFVPPAVAPSGAPGAAGPVGAAGPAAAAGLAAFIICCAISIPAPNPTPAPASPPPSLAAAIGNDCATWNCV